MIEKRICTTGDEVMVHTRERHFLILRRGEIRKIKRSTNRRERREGRAVARDTRQW